MNEEDEGAFSCGNVVDFNAVAVDVTFIETIEQLVYGSGVCGCRESDEQNGCQSCQSTAALHHDESSQNICMRASETVTQGNCRVNR